MDKIVIEGGQPLNGNVRINGAKNAALLIQCAALLGDTACTLRHLPNLSDVRTMGKLLAYLGCEVSMVDTHTMRIDPRGVLEGDLEAPYDTVKTMRASVTVMGPLLARYGRARVSLPGGCAIGARPIDQHLKGLEALGAEIQLENGYVVLQADRLRGGAFVFDKVTVGGTQNVMMAATLAKGTSRLENVAREPEVEELARFLNKMGAKISGAGTSVIEIEGVDNLSGIDHAVIADRIEAGTLAIAAAITGGNVLLEDAPVDHMHATIAKLEEAGVECRVEPDGLRVLGPEEIRPIDVSPVHGAGFVRERAEHHHRDHLREPLHARARAGAHGRRRHGQRKLGDHPGTIQAHGRHRDGHRSPGVGLPRGRGPRRPGRDRGPAGLPPRPRLRGHRRPPAAPGSPYPTALGRPGLSVA